MVLQPDDCAGRVGELVACHALAEFERIHEVQAIGERGLMAVPAVLVEVSESLFRGVG